MMKAYIAGAMTGMPDLNYPEFYRIEGLLQEELGWETVNPAALDQLPESELFAVDGSALPLYLRRDFKELVHCDAIVLLRSWPDSPGANAELALARSLNFEVWAVTPDGNGIKPSKLMPNTGILRETWNKFGILTYQDQKRADHKAQRAAEAR